MMTSAIRELVLGLLMATCVLAAPRSLGPDTSQNSTVTCELGGRVYNDGDVIGDPCDGCQCSRYGVMCQLRLCPAARCADAVKPDGECCLPCPTGSNCEYNGTLGRTLIPTSTGCRYSEHQVCFCFYSYAARSMVHYCLPAMPWERTPDCVITPATTMGEQPGRTTRSKWKLSK